MQTHLAAYLENNRCNEILSKEVDKKHYFIHSDIISFIKSTQSFKYQELQEDFSSDKDRVIIKVSEQESQRIPLWLIIRKGLPVKGTQVQLYAKQPRSATDTAQESRYQKNKLIYKTEYHYSTISREWEKLHIP